MEKENRFYKITLKDENNKGKIDKFRGFHTIIIHQIKHE